MYVILVRIELSQKLGRERRTAIIAAAEIDPVRDVQVLCPMNRSGLGARSLNIELQNALNPPGEVRIGRGGCRPPWSCGCLAGCRPRH